MYGEGGVDSRQVGRVPSEHPIKSAHAHAPSQVSSYLLACVPTAERGGGPGVTSTIAPCDMKSAQVKSAHAKSAQDKSAQVKSARGPGVTSTIAACDMKATETLRTPGTLLNASSTAAAPVPHTVHTLSVRRVHGATHHAHAVSEKSVWVAWRGVERRGEAWRGRGLCEPWAITMVPCQ
jgi:hypothetical protein